MNARSGAWVIALALAGCASKADVPTSPPPATVHATPRSAAPEDDRVEITGRLLAHDGTPLRRAAVTVRRPGFRPMTTEDLDADGRFRLSVPPGIYSVMVAAVDHRMVLRSTVVSDDLHVEGRLGTYARSDPGPALPIRSEYLDAEGKVVAPGPASAPRGPEGVYRLELSAKPKEATRLRYQVVSPGGRTYNGPLADDYENDGGGDYWSIVDVSAKDALELDLRALPPAGERPQLQWRGESPTTAAVIDFQDRCYESLAGIRDRMPRTDGQLLEMTDELRAEASALATKARAEVDAATDPTLHALLRATHLTCFGMFLASPDELAPMREEVAWVLEHVSPTDPHPSLLLNFGNVMFLARRDADEAFLAKTEAWLDRQAREHADPNTAIDALSALIYMAHARGDEARVEELYALAMGERFEGMLQRQHLRQQFDPNRVLQRGKPFPAFDFAGLREGAPRVTSTDRAGTLYLIEFWATWCGPCVTEMPELHTVYAAINGAQAGKGKSKGKGKSAEDAGMRRLRPVERPKIEFVFVSLDANPADVETFRKEHWSMPWIHAFVGPSGEQEAMQRYGFFGVPTKVLVDETGTIVELDDALRGEALQATLERVLAERDGKGSP